MITKDIYGHYDELFQKVNEIFGYSGNDMVGDINDYFTILGQLKEKVVKKEIDPYFLILPNDEPLLKIDANTRKIDTKGWESGIGTQGDELAEVIYFSIDRYFDTVDLADPKKEIFIQWENAAGDQGLSMTINKTVNYPSAPNKLVFGWPITSDITKAAGNVKFSVRFYERNTPASNEEYKLYYSFGTITAVLKVNPSQDFEISNPDVLSITNKNAIIYEMMRDSKVSGLDATAIAPTFESISTTPAFEPAEWNLGDNELPFQTRATFTEADKGNESGMGIISYAWYKLDKDQKITTSLGESDGVKNEYRKNTDVVRNSYDHYYTKNADGKYITYIGDIPAEEGVEVYKLFTTLNPQKAGYYYVVATNNAGRGNSKSITSNKWLIAFAKDPTITYPEGIKNMIISDTEVGINLVPTVNNVDNGELTYQWKVKDTLEGEYRKLDGMTKASLEKVVSPGYYALDIVNTKNNSTAMIQSDDMRVTFPAAAIEGIRFEVDNVPYQPGVTTNFVSPGAVIRVIYNDLRGRSDNITYKWAKDDEDLQINANQCIVTAPTGEYSVVITNTYNNDIQTAEAKITVRAK